MMTQALLVCCDLVMVMTRGKGAARSPLGEAPHALEFLDALDVARLVCTEKRAVAEAAGGLWFWICERMRRLLPHVDMPRDPPSRAALQPLVLLVLLRRLHAVSTCECTLVSGSLVA